MWFRAFDSMSVLWVAAVLSKMCMCEDVRLSWLWAILWEDPSLVSIKVTSSLHLLLSPRFTQLSAAANTLSNINISKPSTDNSLPLYFSLFLYCPLFSIPFLSFSLFRSLPCSLSLTDSPSFSSLQQGKHHCHGEKDDNNEAAANHTYC